MEQNQNQDLLEEVYRATQMGLEGIRAVTPKIEDTQLKKEIRREEAVYQKFVSRAEEMLAAKGAIPQTHDGVKKAMLWGSVQMNTLMDSSPEHMAELLINGTTMGIVDMTKKNQRAWRFGCRRAASGGGFYQLRGKKAWNSSKKYL